VVIGARAQAAFPKGRGGGPGVEDSFHLGTSRDDYRRGSVSLLIRDEADKNRFGREAPAQRSGPRGARSGLPRRRLQLADPHPAG
jgi:hypothetical protein